MVSFSENGDFLSLNIRTLQKKTLESIWTHRCRIILRNEVTDPVTNLTDFTEETVFDEIPCKLSFKLPFSKGNTTVTGEAARINQSVKLFLPPDIIIPPGSKIIVTHGNRITEYAGSGQPSVFPGHQEINLVLFERWA